MARIYRWFMEDVSHVQMAAARILVGICLFGAYAVRTPYMPMLYGPNGFAGVEFAETVGSKNLLSFGLGKWMLFLAPEWLTYIFYGLLLLSAFCFTIGYKSRLFGILLILLHVTFDQRNSLATAGWSKLAHCFVFYIVCSRGGEIWSLDSWLKPREKLATIAPIWPIRWLQLHVCTMYFVSSFPRLQQDMWTKGYAVTFTLLHFEHSRFNSYFFGLTDLLKIPDWSALVLESFAWFALWLPGIGSLWALGLCGLHLTLEATTHVDWWNFMMLGGLMSFIPKEWFRYES